VASDKWALICHHRLIRLSMVANRLQVMQRKNDAGSGHFSKCGCATVYNHKLQCVPFYRDFFDVSIPNAMVTGFALLRTFLLPGAQCVPVWEPYPPPDVEKADPQLFFRLI
jgi:hypothetical protein